MIEFGACSSCHAITVFEYLTCCKTNLENYKMYPDLLNAVDACRLALQNSHSFIAECVGTSVVRCGSVHVPEQWEGVVSCSGTWRCPSTDRDINSHCRHSDKPEQQDDCFWHKYVCVCFLLNIRNNTMLKTRVTHFHVLNGLMRI